MGIWCAPYKIAQAQRLARIMDRPLLAKKASLKLYNLIGDDLLYDYIEQFNPSTDVRPIIKLWLVHFLESQDLTDEVWNKEALKICIKII